MAGNPALSDPPQDAGDGSRLELRRTTGQLAAATVLLLLLVCAGLVIVRVSTGDWRASALAGGVLAGILVLYALFRPEADRQTA